METLRIPERYRIFDGAALKWIAIITMFIDHSAKGVLYLGFLKPRFPVAKGSDLYTLYQLYKVLRGVGRIAFPIFCFFLIQGFLYTRSREKYMLRMLVFALVSEIPFDLALYGRIVYPTHQNVYFTLLLGLLMLYLWELIQNRVKPLFLATIFQVAEAVALMYLSTFLLTDYKYKGLILILVFYLLRFNQVLQCFGGAVAIYWEWPYVLIAFPLLLLYNGKRGKQNKYLFYAFYPAHLVLIYFLRLLVLHLFPA